MDKPIDEQRNFLLDNIKGLLIFLVVFGHSLEIYKSKHTVLGSIYVFIYLFHMPSFVFVSGYFSKNVEKCRETAFKNFFIPFLIFNTIWQVPVMLFKGPEAFSFIVPGWALWYLISMFFWRIFFKDLIRIRYIIPISLIIGLGAGVFPEFDALLSLSRTLVFLPFFLVGYFVTEEDINKIRKPHKIFAVFIILLTGCVAVFTAYTNIFPIEFLYGSASFESNTLPLWLGFMGRALLYFIGFAFIFVLLSTGKDKKTFFSKIGLNTFSVYILHPYLLPIAFIINFLVKNIYLNLIINFLASIFVTYILSKDSVNGFVQKFLNKISKIFLFNT